MERMKEHLKSISKAVAVLQLVMAESNYEKIFPVHNSQ